MMNKRILKVGLMIGYLLFFILMDFWVISIKDSFNTMEPLSYGFYTSRFWLMQVILFFKWFVLGILLNFMSDIKKLKFKIDIIYLGVGLACLAICLLVRLTLFVPVPLIIYGQENFMVQLFCLAPIFPGFFVFEGLFSSGESS